MRYVLLVASRSSITSRVISYVPAVTAGSSLIAAFAVFARSSRAAISASVLDHVELTT